MPSKRDIFLGKWLSASSPRIEAGIADEYLDDIAADLHKHLKIDNRQQCP